MSMASFNFGLFVSNICITIALCGMLCYGSVIVMTGQHLDSYGGIPNGIILLAPSLAFKICYCLILDPIYIPAISKYYLVASIIVNVFSAVILILLIVGMADNPRVRYVNDGPKYRYYWLVLYILWFICEIMCMIATAAVWMQETISFPLQTAVPKMHKRMRLYENVLIVLNRANRLAAFCIWLAMGILSLSSNSIWLIGEFNLSLFAVFVLVATMTDVIPPFALNYVVAIGILTYGVFIFSEIYVYRVLDSVQAVYLDEDSYTNVILSQVVISNSYYFDVDESDARYIAHTTVVQHQLELAMLIVGSGVLGSVILASIGKNCVSVYACDRF